MEKELNSGAIWNSAALAGLQLGLATIALTLASSLAADLSGLAGGLLRFLLWAAKLVCCILLLRRLLRRFQQKNEAPDGRTVYKFGLRTVLFSSLLVAAYAAVTLLLTDKGEFMEQIEEAMVSLPVKLDSNSRAAMEAMLPKLPFFTLLSTFAYCFLWGWVLTSIFTSGRNRAIFDGEEESIDNQ